MQASGAATLVGLPVDQGYRGVQDLTVLQIRDLVNKLYHSDPVALKRVVGDVVDELGESRAELARQDDVLQSLMLDLASAQAEALRLQEYVSQDILGREFAKQGGHASLVSPLSPSPPVAGALRGELRARPAAAAAATAAFDADRFADHLAANLTQPARVVHRILSDVEDAAQWAGIVAAFEKRHPDSCLTTLVLSACPQAKDLLRGRGVGV